MEDHRGQRAQAAVDAAIGGVPNGNIDSLYAEIKRRLKAEKDPGILQLLSVRPELVVKIERPVMELDESTLRGRLARLVVDAFFNAPATGNAAFNELKRRGLSTAKPNVYREMDKLAEQGFVTKEGEGYQKAPDAVIRGAEKRVRA